MPQTITLSLPDDVLQPVQRVAQATKQSVGILLVIALQAALPSLEGLPPDVMQDLTEPWSLSMIRPYGESCSRWCHLTGNVGFMICSRVIKPAASQIREREQLAILQQQADLVMLRKARAAVLLRFRGKRVRTLGELSQLTATDT